MLWTARAPIGQQSVFSDNHDWTHDLLDWSRSNQMTIDSYSHALQHTRMHFDGSQPVRLINFFSSNTRFQKNRVIYLTRLIEDRVTCS